MEDVLGRHPSPVLHILQLTGWEDVPLCRVHPRRVWADVCWSRLWTADYFLEDALGQQISYLHADVVRRLHGTEYFTKMVHTYEVAEILRCVLAP